MTLSFLGGRCFLSIGGSGFAAGVGRFATEGSASRVAWADGRKILFSEGGFTL